MARPKLEDIAKCAEICLSPLEICELYDCNMEDINHFRDVWFDNIPSKDILFKTRLRRGVKSGCFPSNLNHKLRQALMNHIADIVIREMGGVENIVGYSMEELIFDFSMKFKEGMSWDNWGDWQIDHIKPRKLFTSKELKECFELNNLQPLWKKDNLKKGSSYE